MNQPRWKTQIFYTTSAPVKAEPGPSYLQNHGNPVFYKVNITLMADWFNCQPFALSDIKY